MHSLSQLPRSGFLFSLHRDSAKSAENLEITRKYPLCRYILGLGVLTHSTALDQLWGGDRREYSDLVSEYSVVLKLNIRTSAGAV